MSVRFAARFAALALTLTFTLAFALFAGCYSPTIADGQFTCAGGGACPSGFQCTCGACRPSGVTGCLDGGSGADASDAAMPQDLAAADGACASPCSNGCARSPQDPGTNPQVAICPGAWKLGGVNTPAACNHAPHADGTNGLSTDCAMADNCAAGWHVCRGEADLMSRNFHQADCAALVNAGALWLTAQQGDAQMPDGGGPPMGAPMCSIQRLHFAFGCGSLGMTPMSCTILNRVLVDPPGGDPCSSSTGGVFSCASSPVANSVTKSGIAGGGVLCCVDP
ncbi:MAG TPA: hypothetical protein VFF06_13095 [Polyangia bacterium]|nr:hypothetical protein [Polyangia bacterium]